ncbi:ATP-binding protein [Phaeacidiphilus oryzae]|uniref:ATP-binding protein n=1 Tax=Phaeacidiphilus oryzae TaxID=348818 RepID=UPI0007C7B91B|nr:ATP-binding protein [Phaeacidiphilus oryzae]
MSGTSRNDRADHPDRSSRNTPLRRPGQPGLPGLPGQPGQPSHPGHPVHQGHPVHPGHPAQPPPVDQPAAAARRALTAAAAAKAGNALRGLRFRLVVGFTLVAVAGVLATGVMTFREARIGVLQQSQDMVVDEFRDSVDTLAPDVPVPPGQTDLSALAEQLSWTHRSQHWRVLATYGDRQAASPTGDRFPELTPALRRSVGTRSVAVFQRVRTGGRSSLVVGLPVAADSADGTRIGSGLDLYLVVPQSTEQENVDALVGAAERAAVPALGLAVLLALFVAQGVLRPVRALRQATRRMAAGRLDTRLSVHGSDELADLSRAFNETAAALEQSVTELRRMEAQAHRFVADVSHELRTPLAAMSAVTDILDGEAAQLTGDTADAVRLVSEETARLARLVDDLMEISRFDAGAAELRLDEIDLAESVRHTLAGRGWQDRVVTRLPAPGVLRATVDPRRFDVVVANLVGNALSHGSPPVTLTLERLRARPSAGGAEQVRLTVRDRGPGIPGEALPHIFERFYKASSARVRSESSGLGLAITKENVRLHGGRIRAASHPQEGTVFTVDLPVRPAAPNRAGAPEAVTGPDEEPAWA